MSKKQLSLEDKKGKQLALKHALHQVTKDYGRGAIMHMDDKPQNIATIPTGSLALDNALGIGGYPKGRIIEIYGPESSGKTTLALEASAEVQKHGGNVVYIDAEDALDPKYAKNLGINMHKFLLSQPDSGEEALGICDLMVSSGSTDLVVVDSVPALVPKAEIEGEMGDTQVGLQARMMSQALRRLTGEISKTGTTVIFINQIRQKVGVFFGSPETTPGGEALKFYSSVIVRISRGTKIKKNGIFIGNHTNVNIKKNKVAPPFRKCHIDIMYGTGISKMSELINMATDKNIITKSGAWYSYQGQQLGQGLEKSKAYLADRPELAKKIYHQVRRAYHLDPGDDSNQTESGKDDKRSKSASKAKENK